MGSLELINIHKSFGNFEVIKNINLKIADGEFIVFIGPSGCGKSTLLRIIAGLEKVPSGQILINNENVNARPPSERGIAMVFQSYALYPHLTVYGNMSLGLKQAKYSASFIKERINLVCKMLSLDGYMHRRPAELSGGQRQRVAIGRAIVRNPALFLFDEPLSNLDAVLRINTRLEIAKLHRDLKSTMIYVTHDQTEAMTLANRIVVLNNGRIEQIGAPMELYKDPANMFVAGFIGSPKMNFIDANLFSVDFAKTVGIRPEHITLNRHEGQFKGRITHIEYLGSDTNIYVNIADTGMINVRLFGENDFTVDEIVFLQPYQNMLFYFDQYGQRVFD